MKFREPKPAAPWSWRWASLPPIPCHACGASLLLIPSPRIVEGPFLPAIPVLRLFLNAILGCVSKDDGCIREARPAAIQRLPGHG